MTTYNNHYMIYFKTKTMKHKTRISPNSIEAFKELDLGKRQTEVFDCIKKTGSITAKGIAFFMHVEINKITGRVNELMHKHLIKIKSTVKDKSTANARVNLYSIRKESDPLNVFEKSWEEKFNELVQMLEDQHPDVLHKYNALYNHEI